MIEQLDLGKDMGRTLARNTGTEMHQQKLIQHMRLIGQKDKVGRFLLETQRFYAKIGEIDPLGRLPR